MDYLFDLIIDRQRAWADYKTFCVVSGGLGDEGRALLEPMRKGDRIFCCIWPKGYFALGRVLGPAVLAQAHFGTGDFVPKVRSVHWESIARRLIPFVNHRDDEWVVPVEWVHSFPNNKPQKVAGMQHPDEVRCIPLTDRKTAEYLGQKFRR